MKYLMKQRPCNRTICEVASSPEVGGALSLLLTPDEDVDQLMERVSPETMLKS
jgi:hypothetical protein